MNKFDFIKFLLFFTAAAALASPCGAEYTVDPSSVKVIGVDTGKKTRLQNTLVSGKYFLAVTNSGNQNAKYGFEVISCKEYGCDPYPGYEDLPEAGWFIFDPKAAEIKPGKTLKLRNAFVRIPGKAEYKGRKFQAVIKVMELPSTNSNINIEVILPIWIEISK